METVPIPDTFISGLGEVERLGGDCYRYTFFVTHQIGNGEQERIVVAKLIAHASCVPDAIMKTIGAVGGKTTRMLPEAAEAVH
jgi:hypothetical protein